MKTVLRIVRPLPLALAMMWCALLLPAAPGAAQGGAGATVDLAARLTTGDEQSYTFRTETKQSMMVGATPPSMQGSEVESVMRTRVREVDGEGVATVQFVYERMKVKVASPQGNFDFDSEWPIARDAGNPIAPAVRALVGKTILARVSPAGELVDMKGVDTTNLDPMVARTMSELVNPESFRQLIHLLYGLKADPSTAAPEDKWTEMSTLPSGVGTMEITREFTLESVIAGKAYVDVGGGIVLVIDPVKQASAPGAEFLQWKSGDVSGRVVWDTNNGRLERVEVATEIVTTDSNPVYQGNLLTVTITSKSSLARRI